MSTVVKVKNDSTPVKVEVLVTGQSVWALSFQSASNHKRDSDDTRDIELGPGSGLIDAIDNWQFNVSHPGDNVALSLRWKQGGEEIGRWPKDTAEGQLIYVGECLYEEAP